MCGYYRQPQLTSEIITSDGWFKTGDLGYLDNHGFLFISGRKKEMIISAGENIFPAEIEKVLSEHPAIAECAVIGIPDKIRGEIPKAFVVLKENIAAGPEEIKCFCQGKIAHYKIPGRVEFLRELPRSPTGKILKKELS
ncbi:MAG: hypothetical protein AAB019_04305 [Planctomycetota bacterium]